MLVSLLPDIFSIMKQARIRAAHHTSFHKSNANFFFVRMPVRTILCNGLFVELKSILLMLAVSIRMPAGSA